jgi:hypothetical protein
LARLSLCYHGMCGRYVVKTPIKTIAKMHRVFDVPLF